MQWSLIRNSIEWASTWVGNILSYCACISCWDVSNSLHLRFHIVSSRPTSCSSIYFINTISIFENAVMFRQLTNLIGMNFLPQGGDFGWIGFGTWCVHSGEVIINSIAAEMLMLWKVRRVWSRNKWYCRHLKRLCKGKLGSYGLLSILYILRLYPCHAISFFGGSKTIVLFSTTVRHVEG